MTSLSQAASSKLRTPKAGRIKLRTVVRRSPPASMRRDNHRAGNKRKRLALFDHFVRAGEKGCRDVKTELLRRPEVDHQFVLGWRLHRQIGGLLALEDAIDVTGRAPVLVFRIRPVRGEAPTRGIVSVGIDVRLTVPQGERND